MRIGICGPINPSELREFLREQQILPSINKGASAINTYVKELLRQGHNVVAFTSAVPSKETNNIVLKGDCLEIHVIHSTPGLFLTHTLSRLYMVRRLKNYMRPYIGELDVLHAQWTYDFALAAKAYENVIPVFCTVRDWCPYIMSIQKGLRKAQWYLYYVIFKNVMNSKRIQFIANSEYTRDQIATKYPSKKTCIIYNPIDKAFILNKKLLDIQGIVFISIASSLTEGRKNIKTLLEAFHIFHNEHPDSRLKLVGSGLEMETPFYLKYKALGLLDSVDILGQLKHDDLIKEIDKSTCLVHPSLEETFGNILIEGMARRIPVIGGKNAGAVPQVLENGECGVLCDVENVDSMFAAMEQAINKEFSRVIVDKATKTIKKKYSSDSIVEKHVELYEKYQRNNMNS